MHKESDADILDRIASGDEDAMRTLYERYQSIIRAFAFSRLKDEYQASDVLHDVMVDVWRKAGTFSGKSAAKSWLLSITRNKAVDRIRKSSRIELGDDGLDLVDGEPTPEEALSAAQDKERVRHCISKLPEAKRTAVHLAFFEMLSYAEIADIEGVPVGTIKTRIHNAKKALASCVVASAAL